LGGWLAQKLWGPPPTGNSKQSYQPFLIYLTSPEILGREHFRIGQITQEWLIGLLRVGRRPHNFEEIDIPKYSHIFPNFIS